MIAGIQSSRPGPELSPARWIAFSLPLLLALFPPETRGESMAGCAILIAVLALIDRRSAPFASGQAALLLFLAAALPLSLVALAPAAAVQPLAVALLAAALGLSVSVAGFTDRCRRMAGIILGGVAGAVAVHALVQWGWGLDRLSAIVLEDLTFPDREAALVRLSRERPFASFATPAALGGFLSLALPVTTALAWSARGATRGLWAVVALCQTAALLAAASATATAALLLGVLLAAWVWSGSRRALVAIGLSVALLLGAVVLLRGGRLTDLSDREGPWRLRAGNFRVAWSMAADHPWTGVGPGGFSEAYPAYRRPGDNETRHAHNLPLELAAELGWPVGIAVTVLFFVLLLRPLWRERDGPLWRRGLALGLATFALHNLADFTAFMPSLLWTAALLCGLLSTSLPAPNERRGTARLLPAATLTAVWLAASVAALSGLSANARIAARSWAFAAEPVRALEQATRATSLAPWDVEASLLAARVSADAGLPSAIERADQAVRLSPVRPSARQLRSRLRLEAGDPLGAYADLCEAARLDPLDDGYRTARDRLARSLLAAAARSVP